SSTDMSGNSSRPSGTYATPARATLCGGQPVIGVPSSLTLPPLAGTRPMIVLTVVVLPTPLRPSTAAMRPFRNDAAPMQHGDPVRQPEHHLHVVLDEQHRDAGALKEMRQRLDSLCRLLDREPLGGLVQ